MPNQSVDTILNELADPNASIRDLLAVYIQGEYRPLWRQDPVLYRAFAWTMVRAGHPTQAFELVREGLFDHPLDSELKYLRALALARGGNLSKAADYAGELLGSPALDLHLRSETLSLLGRIEKDRYQRAGDARSQRRFEKGVKGEEPYGCRIRVTLVMRRRDEIGVRFAARRWMCRSRCGITKVIAALRAPYLPEADLCLSKPWKFSAHTM